MDARQKYINELYFIENRKQPVQFIKQGARIKLFKPSFYKIIHLSRFFIYCKSVLHIIGLSKKKAQVERSQYILACDTAIRINFFQIIERVTTRSWSINANGVHFPVPAKSHSISMKLKWKSTAGLNRYRHFWYLIYYLMPKHC